MSRFSTAWRFGGYPPSDQSFVRATPHGNILPPYALPSALGMILGAPPSMYAASELVVPRSIPMILAIRITLISHDDDLGGTQDPVVKSVSFPQYLFYQSVL